MTDGNSFLVSPFPYTLAAIRTALLEWYAAYGRNLPWRHTRDPYQIMVSEIMLQQTQVDRVMPKYRRFLELFPTLEALAAAPTADVIRAWTGLGYNRRAVNMQRAARAVLHEHSGQFPRDLAALLKLPGIGPYTAGALACFAFEQDVAFLDTNIRRVVQRLFVGPEESTPASEAQLLTLAETAVPPGRGWAWNQAIMELGALICTAAAPACWRCPVQMHCRAYADRRAADEQLFSNAADLEPRPIRRVAERREAPYAGSNRFYRGRAIEALRRLPPGGSIGLAALGRQIKDSFGDHDMPWLRALVEGLARDGLLVLAEEQARLP
ncbi:MAG TPA: A/G-specific adenine glycosylase [Roseiflexaceae bacterium]|nr:A/G-specific adenine glycosylase [Roseiflexaceae bacterium]